MGMLCSVFFSPMTEEAMLYMRVQLGKLKIRADTILEKQGEAQV